MISRKIYCSIDTVEYTLSPTSVIPRRVLMTRNTPGQCVIWYRSFATPVTHIIGFCGLRRSCWQVNQAKVQSLSQARYSSLALNSILVMIHFRETTVVLFINFYNQV